MPPNHHIAIPEPLINTLRGAQAVTILTGAGISAESGIPTFRESQTGLWARYDPQELATPEAFRANPALVMDWYRWRKDLVSRAQPNAGHFALAEFERRLPNFTLITQNVDGLHHIAGSRNIVELHGSLKRLRCQNVRRDAINQPQCDYRTTEWPDSQLARCPSCGGLLRPDVVWFGESLHGDALNDALSAARLCDLFFSIGTSGVVEPAASLPYEAIRAGAVVVEINPMPTPLSVYAQYELPYPAAVVLPEILRAAWPVD